MTAAIGVVVGARQHAERTGGKAAGMRVLAMRGEVTTEAHRAAGTTGLMQGLQQRVVGGGARARLRQGHGPVPDRPHATHQTLRLDHHHQSQGTLTMAPATDP